MKVTRYNGKWMVVDDFCEVIDHVKASAIDSGFGSWLPNKGKFGSSIYEHMNFWTFHSPMLMAIDEAINGRYYPNDCFVRYALPETEKAYTHSDRTYGDMTCVCYLSEHEEEYGTGFYKHRATGLTEMPPVTELDSGPQWDQLKHDMIHGTGREWEEVGRCIGKYNRAVIFHAPLFHARIPKTGLGTGPTDARMVWCSHGVVA